MKHIVRILAVLAVLALLYGLLIVLAVYAQGPGEEETKVDTSGEIGAAGLANPIPAGYTRVYLFTSVANDDSAPDQIATSVHCTNYGSQPTIVQVVLYTYSGIPYTGTTTIYSNQTMTFSSQMTVIFFEDVNISAGAIFQGSGQVIATRPTIICSAQLLDPVNNQPVFMARLPLFSAINDVYVPSVIKN